VERTPGLGVDFIIAEVAKRQTAEDRFYAGADPETGEVQ
jgi:hypothetical protein